MIIGLPKEVKNHEYRVAMTPELVAELTARGHQVIVQEGAGAGSGFADELYQSAGAELSGDVDALWKCAEMIVKVKEPIEEEYARLQEGQLLFTYLHLAAVPALAQVLLERSVSAVAYETIELADGQLPLLTPMSQVAGRMATQVGAQWLTRARGGKGILLGGVPGVRRGRVVIIGGGIVGRNAAQMAVGLGAEVSILDIDARRLAAIDSEFGGRVNTYFSAPHTIAERVRRADLVIGAVLITGAKAPTLVPRSLIAEMEPGSVVVDVAVDQGGCIETCRPTTHDAPTFIVDGVIHYCVANMPGAVSRTSTLALTSVTRPHLLRLADEGLQAAMNDPALRLGVNCHQGRCTHEAVADSLGLPYAPLTLS